MNFILCGPPGCGKSTLGKRLADRLQRAFIDTDQLIESRCGLSCREIVLQKGEDFFRQKEKEIIFSLNPSVNAIMALGGGTLLDQENALRLQQLGKLVFLKADFSLLWERLMQKSHLPSYLASGDLVSKNPCSLTVPRALPWAGALPALRADKIVAKALPGAGATLQAEDNVARTPSCAVGALRSNENVARALPGAGATLQAEDNVARIPSCAVGVARAFISPKGWKCNSPGQRPGYDYSMMQPVRLQEFLKSIPPVAQDTKLAFAKIVELRNAACLKYAHSTIEIAQHSEEELLSLLCTLARQGGPHGQQSLW